MDPEIIRKWRPTKFSEIAGADNQRRLKRIQRQLLKGKLPTPLLLVGAFGYGKTSVARLLLKSLCCLRRDPITADPCHACTYCRHFGKFYNGHGDPYRRFEYDCTHFGRVELIKELDEHRYDRDVMLFMDELHHLNEKHAQEPMLKFVEDFDGLVIAAVMEDRLDEVIPPLRERFEIVRLTPPTEEEMVAFFSRMSEVWDIHSTPDILSYMARESGKSFRFAMKAHAAAADEPDRTLSRTLVQDLLGV